MWLKKLFWYLLMLLKYVVVGSIVAIIIGIFFPPAALIVGGLFLIGSFGAAYKDYKEKILPRLEYKQLKKRYKKAKSEFDGFDDMLRIVQRNI
jgi:hypothetical protein